MSDDDSAPRGMAGIMVSVRIAPDPRPTTVRGWLHVAIGTLLRDVLRRCACAGCWNHGAFPTLLSGRLCLTHWIAYYASAEQATS